jgi:hypothetical protein
VRPSPFPAGSLGFSLAAAASGLLDRRCSSLRVVLPLEALQPSVNRTHERFASAPLLGFRSPTALHNPGCPYAPEVPPSGTVRPQGFSPSRRLASPVTLRALFHARCALGVPADLLRSPSPFGQGRAEAPTSPLQGVLLSRDGCVFAHPPLACFTGGDYRSTLSRLWDPVSRNSQPDGHLRVLITGESVYPSGATREHQPS